MKAKIYYMHALTALHAGTGQGNGVIDLPIARERSTGLPLIPGSGIKGVLREELRPNEGVDKGLWKTLFGPESVEAESGGDAGFAGALTIQDALLLSLPVRSIYGVFAWVSCPFVWQRYKRDCIHSDVKIPTGSVMLEDQVALITKNSQLVSDKERVYLEDIDLTAKASESVDAIAKHLAEEIFPGDSLWQDYFQQRFIIVPDEVFSFLDEVNTEVRARIKLDTGPRTVKKGALWYEENLPAETLVWGVLGCDRSRQKGHIQKAEELIEAFGDQLLPEGEARLQVGGKATVGRGQVRWLLSTKEAKNGD